MANFSITQPQAQAAKLLLIINPDGTYRVSCREGTAKAADMLRKCADDIDIRGCLGAA